MAVNTISKDGLDGLPPITTTIAKYNTTKQQSTGPFRRETVLYQRIQFSRKEFIFFKIPLTTLFTASIVLLDRNSVSCYQISLGPLKT